MLKIIPNEPDVSFSLEIIFILTKHIPPLFENCRSCRLNRIITSRIQVTLLRVFFTAFVIGITPRPGVAHLNKFARHIHTDKIILLSIKLEELINFPGRFNRRCFIFIAPVGEYFAL